MFANPAGGDLPNPDPGSGPKRRGPGRTPKLIEKALDLIRHSGGDEAVIPEIKALCEKMTALEVEEFRRRMREL
jgi:hypothetical protein